MSNPNIDKYIRSLQYNPQVLLSVVPDGTTSSLPTKERQTVNNGVIICTKKNHTLKKNLDEVAILNPSAGVIFPGALIQADQALMDGIPTPITLPRVPVTLSLDLPGLSEPSRMVQPDYSSVQTFINAKLEEWNQGASRQGYMNAASSILQVTKAYTSQQVALDLGFNAKWAAGSASAQVGVSSTTEKSVVVAYYKQVFYTVTMNTPTTPSSVFSDVVSLKEIQAAFTNDCPPAYIRSVDYGRILMIKMESTKLDTAVNLKGAFEQATSAGVTAGGNLASTYKEIIDNSTFTVLAVGGGAQSPTQMFNGAAELKGLQEYIVKDATYRRENPGKPIAYTVAFLKDNAFARMGNSAEYTETECIRYNNGFVRFVHDGGYVAKFQVTWAENDPNGNPANKQWDSGEKTAGYSYQVDLPGDAQGVRVKAWAATGLVWDPWGEIMNIALSGPDNKTYRARGTTLNRSWDNG